MVVIIRLFVAGKLLVEWAVVILQREGERERGREGEGGRERGRKGRGRRKWR